MTFTQGQWVKAQDFSGASGSYLEKDKLYHVDEVHEDGDMIKIGVRDEWFWSRRFTEAFVNNSPAHSFNPHGTPGDSIHHTPSCPDCGAKECEYHHAGCTHGRTWIAPPDKPKAILTAPKAVLGTQVGGSHYTDCAIQPIEYIWANKLGFSEGNIIKYVTRWRSKGGVKDLEKAKHHIALLIEHTLAEQDAYEAAGHPALLSEAKSAL